MSAGKEKEAASAITVAAKRALRDALRKATSVVWFFHSSEERQSSVPANALPVRVSRHWPVCFVACLANDHRHWTRLAPRNTGQWPQKRGSRVLLRPSLEQAFKLLFALLLCFSINDGYAQDQNEPTPITVTEVISTSVAPTVPAAGTVFSRNESQVTAGMAGRLEWLAEPGDFVESGALVAIFDCEMLELQRERQLAEAERADINFERLAKEVERLESVRDTNVIAEIQLDRTVADRDLARSDRRIAQIAIRETDSQLSRCNVRAPFSGVVTQRLRNAGEDVERSTILAAMTDTENLEVRASVPIRYLPRMRADVAAEVRLSELRLEARIRKVVPAANSQSQTFEVRLDLPADAPRVVAAGQLVSVNLPLSPNVALTVPRDSVVLREDGAFVMRINDDAKAERIAVEVREASGDNLAVRGALQSGDRVAVRGAEALDDGELVAVQTET